MPTWYDIVKPNFEGDHAGDGLLFTESTTCRRL